MTEPRPDSIDRLRAEFQAELAAADSDRALQAVRDRYLARKGGVIATLMKAVAAAAPDERPALGRLANELKNDIEARVADKRAAVDRRICGAGSDRSISTPALGCSPAAGGDRTGEINNR